MLRSNGSNISMVEGAPTVGFPSKVLDVRSSVRHATPQHNNTTTQQKTCFEYMYVK